MILQPEVAVKAEIAEFDKITTSERYINFSMFSGLTSTFPAIDFNFFRYKYFRKQLTEDTGKAEIAEFDNTIPSEQNVFRFDITMNTVVHVAVVDCLQRLPDYARSCWHRNSENMK